MLCLVGGNDEDMSRMLKAMISQEKIGNAQIILDGENIASIKKD